MAIKAVNNIAGLNGLILILLIFSTFPWINKLDPLVPSIAQYTATAKKAINKIKELYTKI